MYAFVTGGSRGIGRDIVLKLASAGYDVAFSYHKNKEAADKTLEEISQMGREGISVKMDVSVEDDVKNAVKEVESRFGALHALVNNAGVLHMKELEATGLNEWDNVLKTNLTGVFLVTKYFLPLLRRSGDGSIVNISSIAGETAGIASAAYSATKGGVIALTRKLAAELAPHIRVNAVAPGLVETEMTEDYLKNPENREKMELSTPLKRVARPKDIAQVVLFLLSQAASFITGEVINVNGGRYMA
ncbi:MAG TPA: 3-oxoacyl-ACP reductase FabG [Nitrospirae bacterium]|nr:3-oxoacyl-ACP reductase FabG [Nitrospirota bacterium]HDO22724.1 3-oxoacyl-ACP reductase FabG [Nitrospirota bacterium]HDO36729.1 3-oxoacyl-ACP reductase FabG [Nitrospirota bacterium]HDZ87591.1 3-oxoacyl-ACP reductase FabG [Nitrospirota bacterium]